MIDKNAVFQQVNDYLKNSSAYLVGVEVKQGNIIVVEIDHDDGVSIEECVKLSRFLEAAFDRNIEDYELQVTSAGLSSPFKLLRQYAKNVGKDVEILTKDGQKLIGTLKSADETHFVITVLRKVKPEGAKRKITKEENVCLSYNEIKYTKTVIRFN